MQHSTDPGEVFGALEMFNERCLPPAAGASRYIDHDIEFSPTGRRDLGDVVLTKGDGAGLVAERAVSLTARETTEILLLDLGEHSERFRK